MRRSPMHNAHIRTATVLRVMPDSVLFIIAGSLLAFTTDTGAGSLWGSHGIVIKADAWVVACVAIGLLLGIRLLFDRLRRHSWFSPCEDRHEEPWI